MPRYAVFLYHDADPATTDPDTAAAQMAEHDQHGRDLVAEGVMVFGTPLEDPVASTSIRASGIVDAPFLETKEVIVGFYVIDVDDLDAALAVARRNPIIAQGGGVEVRPMPDDDAVAAHQA